MSKIVVAKIGPTTPSDDQVVYEGESQWFVVEPDALGKSRSAPSGPASLADCPEQTLISVMQTAATKKGDKAALSVERVNGMPPPLKEDDSVPPALPPQEWTVWTFKKYHEDVRTAAKGFMHFGFPEFGTVNVWGYNAPEWNISAFAGIYAGGKVGGIYPTDTPDVVAYKIVHSSGSVVAVDDKAKADKLVQALNERKDAQHVKLVVAWAHTPAEGETLNIEGCGDVPFISWERLLQLGRKVPDASLEERVKGVQPQHCAVLVYTSGTTGDPKAVMLSHDNVIFAATNLGNLVGKSTGLFQGPCRIMSYLPLSHVAGCLNDMCVTLASSAKMDGWTTIMYARVYDIKKATIAQ